MSAKLIAQKNRIDLCQTKHIFKGTNSQAEGPEKNAKRGKTNRWLRGRPCKKPLNDWETQTTRSPKTE